MVLLAGEGVPSPGPSPGDSHHGTVYEMVLVEGGIGFASPGWPSLCLCPCGGYRDYCPRPEGGGGAPKARAGWG